MKNLPPYVKHTLFLFFTLPFAFSSQAQAPAIEWQRTIGGSNGDYINSIVHTSDGGYILGGESSSGISGNKTVASNGSDDYWIVKLTNSGIIQWQKAIGGSSLDQLNSIKQTIDGGYILGGYSSSGISGDKTENSQGFDYWVVKIDSIGLVEWQNTIGGSQNDVLESIQQTIDGGYILGGYSNSGISGDKTENSQGSSDYWVVKLDPTGAIQWQNTIGGSSHEILYSVEQTSDGGYILGGSSQSGLSGDKTEASQGSQDYWVVKLNSLGVIEWQNTIGGLNNDNLRSVLETTDGGFLLGGMSESDVSGDKTIASIGGGDYWLVKVDSFGFIQWQNSIGGSNLDEFISMIKTIDGGYILGGTSVSGISGDKSETFQGSGDYWMVKTNSQGAVLWDKTLGGSQIERFTSISQSIEGEILIGGNSNSGISGDKTEDSFGTFDIWVVKIIEPPVTWTGATSTDWNTGTNWSNSAVPVVSDEIIIPTSPLGAFFPTSTSDISIEDLTIEAGATLTISPGNGLIIGANGSVTNNGSVILEADASGTAWLDDFTNTNTSYIGEITTKQFIDNGSGLGQRMFGSPVNNGVVQGLNQTYAGGSTGQIMMSDCVTMQVDQGSPYSNLFEWREDAVSPNNCEFEAWWAIDDSSPLQNGRGYSGWMQDGTSISFTGVPNTGNITYGSSLSNSNSGLVNKDGWHVLSNPYPSILNANSITTAGWSSLQTHQGASGTYGGTFQPITPGDDIGIMQGFVANNPGTVTSNAYSTSDVLGNTDLIGAVHYGVHFDVSGNGITIDKLGVFDDNQDGIAGNINVRIYDRTTQTIVPGLSVVINGNGDPLEGNCRMRSIPPVLLPAGQYLLYTNASGSTDRVGVTSNGSNMLINSIPNLNFGGSYIVIDIFGAGTYPTAQSSPNFEYMMGNFGAIANTPSASFSNDMRAQGSTSFKSNNSWYNARLDIEVSNGTNQDITYIYFNNDATQAFDNQWDCEKRDSDAGIPTLYTSTTGMNTSLNGNNLAELGDYSFPMGLKPGSTGAFTFTVEGINTFPASTLVYLEDKATGTWTNLREQNTYSFNMTTQEAEDRFEIHFTKPIALTYEAETCEGNDGSIAIDFGNQSIGNQLQIWNYELRINGNVIASGSEAILAELQDLEPGDYEIIFTNGNLQASEWITVEDKAQVEADFDANATTLYVGDELNLSNLSNGATSFEWEVNGEFFSTNDLNYAFSAPGTYVVSLRASNADCEAFMEQSFIVNEKTTGIADQIELDKVLVYTKGNNIVVDLSNTDLKGQTDLEVYNALGQLLIQELDIEMIEQIEMANQARGYYFVNIINQQEQISKKVILK